MDLMRKLESVAKVWCYACNKRSIINEYDEMQIYFEPFGLNIKGFAFLPQILYEDQRRGKEI